MIYFLKSAMCLLLFWSFYKLFLEREKMFVFNRFFLLGSLVLSFVIPVITIETMGKPTTDLSTQPIDFINKNTVENVTNSYDWQLLGFIIYLIVVGVLLFRLVFNIQKVLQKTRTVAKQFWQNVWLVFIDEPQLPHAFLNYIFINKNDFENNKIETELLQHELEHVKQRHSYDIIFIQILKAVFWFNPLLILFEKAIKLNHEFLADQSVIRQFENIKGYQYLLLEKAKGSINNHYLASNINYLITKKRLEMMTKKTNKLMVWAKTALSVGMCIMLCFVFSNKVIAQGKSVSDDLMKEYKTYVEKYSMKDGESVKIYKKDINRMNEIYKEMSNEQQKSVEKMKLPPPPPTPPTPPVPSENAVTPPLPPPPISTPLPDGGKYFVDEKLVTLEEANEILKKGVYKVKKIETDQGFELYITTKKD